MYGPSAARKLSTETQRPLRLEAFFSSYSAAMQPSVPERLKSQARFGAPETHGAGTRYAPSTMVSFSSAHWRQPSAALTFKSLTFAPVVLMFVTIVTPAARSRSHQL